MNKLHGVLEDFIEQKGILRLFVRCWDSISDLKQMQETIQKVESPNRIAVLLLENSSFASNLLHQPLQIGFKESNVIVATKLEGVRNTFKSKILKIAKDGLFARLTLALGDTEKDEINALCDLDFVKSNALEIGDFIFWHIPENEIMLFFDTKNVQPKV